jgi:hypothetical protein
VLDRSIGLLVANHNRWPLVTSSLRFDHHHGYGVLLTYTTRNISEAVSKFIVRSIRLSKRPTCLSRANRGITTALTLYCINSGVFTLFVTYVTPRPLPFGGLTFFAGYVQ